MDSIQIAKALFRQQMAWNQGDLVGFMQGYWENDSLTFISKNGITKGYQKVLSNYQKSYPDKQTMGTLNFELLDMDYECDEHVVVTGKWSLVRLEKPIGGYFTLWFEKIHGEWKIVKDHTS